MVITVSDDARMRAAAREGAQRGGMEPLPKPSGYDGVFRVKMSSIRMIMNRRIQVSFLARERMIARICMMQSAAIEKMEWEARKKKLDREIDEKVAEIKDLIEQSRLVKYKEVDIEVMISVSSPQAAYRGRAGRSQGGQLTHKRIICPENITKEELNKLGIPVDIANAVLRTQIQLEEVRREQKKLVEEANKLIDQLEL